MTDLAEQIGHPVCVHLNLTTNRWVIAPKPKVTAFGTADAVTLTDVTFKVSEAQRQYCIRRNGRWVHAWALGTLASIGAESTSGLLVVTYNPFRAPTFHIAGHEWPVYKARRIHFTSKHGYLAEEDIL